jgi:hypothetical protein
VIDAPGTAEDGLFARDAEGNPLAWSRDAGGLVSGKGGDLSVTLTGARDLPDGRRARPVFELMAERYLGDDYAPETVAEATGIPAEQIRRIAAEIAHVAFKEEITLDRPWTDAWGRKHDKMIGRPVSMHAMRGDLGPFQRVPDLPHDPCAADPAGLHRLPRRLPLQTALPQADAAEPVAPRPAARTSSPRCRWAGRIWVFRTGRSTCLIGEDGTPSRSTRGFRGTRRCRPMG